MQVLSTRPHKGLLSLRLERDRDEIERIRARYGDRLAEVAAYRLRCELMWDLVEARKVESPRN